MGKPLRNLCCAAALVAVKLDLPTSRAQIFSRARSASDRFFMFSAAKASERGETTRNRKREAKDFEKVYCEMKVIAFINCGYGDSTLVRTH